MGQMSPSTRLALQEFVRFAGEYGGTLYFEDFLKNGFGSLPSSIQSIHPHLYSWRGLCRFEAMLSRSVGAIHDYLPLLASRTAYLVKLAGRVLFEGGRRSLMTDLSWPSYASIFQRECGRHAGQLLSIPIRDMILRDRCKPDELISHLVAAVAKYECDGLFLPAVSHEGIRLPLESLAAAMRARHPSLRLIIDGAQAFGHVPLNLADIRCSFFLAGSHKWLGAYLPLGVGFVRKADVIARRPHSLSDPLMHFLAEIRNTHPFRFGETVSLTPLFACCAALEELADIASSFRVRLDNADRIADATCEGWRSIRPHPGLRSGILLLSPGSRTLRCVSPQILRDHFQRHGIAVTVYPGSMVRMAMPDVPFSFEDVLSIRNACRNLDTTLFSPEFKPIQV